MSGVSYHRAILHIYGPDLGRDTFEVFEREPREGRMVSCFINADVDEVVQFVQDKLDLAVTTQKQAVRAKREQLLDEVGKLQARL